MEANAVSQTDKSELTVIPINKDLAFRLRLDFTLENKIDFTGKYRSYIISLLKTAFCDDKEFFDINYGQVALKPFTFSVYFFTDVLKQFNRFILNVSSLNFAYIQKLYNYFSIVKNKKNAFFMGQRIVDVNFSINALEQIKTDTVIFSTFSPVVIRKGIVNLVPDTAENAKDFHNSDRFKIVELNYYAKFFKYSLFYLANKFKIDIDKSKFSFMPLRAKINFSVIDFLEKNISISVPALKMDFVLTADPRLLNLIYAIGAGARRSEGFGMLERKA